MRKQQFTVVLRLSDRDYEELRVSELRNMIRNGITQHVVIDRKNVQVIHNGEGSDDGSVSSVD